jgi:pimeloyl-ACP methyl ester carboxylesterase
MAQIQANGINIEYDTFGDRDARPLLLVMGLGAQMTRWRPEFCEQLADRGHYVIRFDNRDVGLSRRFDEAGMPDMAQIFLARQSGAPVAAPYLLSDMADDAVGVLDALQIERAHVCGASMGGMIVQTMAIHHPARLINGVDHVHHRESGSAAGYPGSHGGPDDAPGYDAR